MTRMRLFLAAIGSVLALSANAQAVKSHQGPPEIDAAAPKGAASTTRELTIYSAKWCPYCKQAKAYMDSKGIAYRDVDIEASPENRAAYVAAGAGGRGIPLITSGERRMRGFSPISLNKLLAAPQ